jgi:acetolactate synthase-1/2/3 large subunit
VHEACQIDKQQTQSWLERIRNWKEDYPLSFNEESKQLLPQEVIKEVNNINNNITSFITTDVGQHQMWAAQLINTGPRKWISSAGLGTMGYGLPAAIGVQIAYPDSTVICITGDASFQMNCQELATIAQYRLPIKIIIINNFWQGMVRQWQQAFYGERYSHSNMNQGMPDFVQLAKAFGIKAICIKNKHELHFSFEKAFATKEPIIIDCHVSKEENCYPMVAPGKSNSQMIGLIKQLKKNALFIKDENFIESET